jgi:hypothetical protein
MNNYNNLLKEKKDADKNWKNVFTNVLNGNRDYLQIALAMMGCNEIDKLLLRISQDDPND